jgi:hypothetical protein
MHSVVRSNKFRRPEPCTLWVAFSGFASSHLERSYPIYLRVVFEVLSQGRVAVLHLLGLSTYLPLPVQRVLSALL